MRHHSLLVLAAIAVLPLSSPAFAQNAVTSTLRAEPIAEETGLRVTLGDLTDNRTTGKHFARLEVELKTEGDQLQQAFGAVKPVITAAVDDTGRSLLKTDKQPDPMFWGFEIMDKTRTSLDDRVEMLNPARRATSVSFAGYVDVLYPARDPSAIYVVKDVLAQAGKPLLPESFRQAGMEISLLTKPLADKMKQEQEVAKAAAEAAKKSGNVAADASKVMGEAFGKMFQTMFSGFFSMGDNDLLFVIKDPKQQIAFLQVEDAAGVPIKNGGGRSMSRDEQEGTVRYSVSYSSALPAGAVLKIYFATPKSLQRVPFKFESQRLP